MPVTINELEITVTVIPEPPAAQGRGGAGAAGANDEGNRRAMLEQCLEQMMQIVENKHER